jgi:hypothetical protein
MGERCEADSLVKGRSASGVHMSRGGVKSFLAAVNFFADERSDEPQTLKSDEVWVSLPFFFENLGTGQLLLIAHHPRRERGHYQRQSKEEHVDADQEANRPARRARPACPDQIGEQQIDDAAEQHPTPAS